MIICNSLAFENNLTENDFSGDSNLFMTTLQGKKKCLKGVRTNQAAKFKGGCT